MGLMNSIRKAQEGVVYFGNTELKPSLVFSKIIIEY